MLSTKESYVGNLAPKFLAATLILLFMVANVGSQLYVSEDLIPSSGQISHTSRLHTQAMYIRDEANNTITLKGINYETLNYFPNGQWVPKGKYWTAGANIWDPNAVKDNLDGIRDWGLNTIRFHFALSWWLTDNSSYRQHLRDIASWAGERQLYVIYDLADPYGNTNPWPPMPYRPWANVSMVNVDGFVQFWREFAADLGGYPNVIFEIYNEPHDIPMDEWQTVHQRCINAIRESSMNLVIVQYDFGLDYFSYPHQVGMSWVWNYPLNGTNIAYSTHVYRYHDHLGTDKPYDYATIKQRLNACYVPDVQERDLGPVLVGETGAYNNDMPAEADFLANLLQILKEWQIHYIGFEWYADWRRFGMLENTAYIPPPNLAGQILINASAQGP